MTITDHCQHPVQGGDCLYPDSTLFLPEQSSSQSRHSTEGSSLAPVFTRSRSVNISKQREGERKRVPIVMYCVITSRRVLGWAGLGGAVRTSDTEYKYEDTCPVSQC